MLLVRIHALKQELDHEFHKLISKMYLIIIMKNFLILNIVFLFVSACSFNTFELSTPSQGLEVNSNKVFYEHFDDQGNFQQAQTFTDPYKELYGQQNFKLRSNYPYETIGEGPINKRVNVVFIGDGYTKSELSKYKDQVNTFIASFKKMQAIEPYKDLFLFHRIDIASNKSGLGTIDLALPQSPLGMMENCNGISRLLCINVELAMAAVSSVPKADLVFAFANTEKYGGAGYRNPHIATVSGGNVHAFELALHEFGHSFANLSDEYDYPGSDPIACMNGPNASATDASDIKIKKSKWFRWLDLPHVSSFMGACYVRDSYRPTFNSKMRTLGRPFEEVNNEQIVLSIYNSANFVDAHTPEGKYAASGFLYIRTPKGLGLTKHWYVNGKRIKEFDGIDDLDVSKAVKKSGENKVELVITDNTSFVRDEVQRQAKMQKRIQWTLIK